MTCSYNNNSVCTPCASGSYSGGGSATVCTQCPPGSAVVGLSLSSSLIVENISRCTACQKYANAEQTACVDACLPGSFAKSPRICSLCPIGTFSPRGISCIACTGCTNPARTRCLPATIDCLSRKQALPLC